MKTSTKTLASMLACAALAVSLVPAIDGMVTDGTPTAPAAHASTSSSARSAYAKTIKNLKSQGMSFGRACLIDVTGDGKDELVSEWWPSIYTYKNGKVKRIFNGNMGSSTFYKVYKKKRVFVYTEPDRMGSCSYTYYQWSKTKGRFVKKCSTYTSKSPYSTSYHTVKGKKVSYSKFKSYRKSLLKGAKSSTVSYWNW